ncbi:phage head-tail adapter protein [Campylobacter sp. faydin G-140]|uniref:phage head-tail adapter protein n=1 Tax=Campylobacter anatolicus TaxID=2829105 RepID=UPI001B932934|nr:phage head-tail adapter protein [Campylobacter anatolicus]MBR8466186.1 phage head-tail adapter protein [Campylobacter anatolicus]
MDTQSRLAELKQRAYEGFMCYKPMLDKLNSAYLLALDEDKALSLKERGKANLFIPKLNAKTKRITDGLSETYFNTDEFAKLECYINSEQKVIDKWQEAINYYTDMIKLYKVFMPIFQKIPFLGTAVAKIYWRSGLLVIEEVELDDVYFDPNAKDHDDIRYIVNRINLSYGDLKELSKQGIFSKEAVSEIVSNEAFIYERLSVYDIYEQDTNSQWKVSTINESGAVLRADIKLKDGCPFIIGYMLPQVRAYDESTFVVAYGEPPLASILPLQDEMNFARNAMIDGINRLLNPKLLVPLNANVSRKDLESMGPTYISQPTAVQIMPPPNVSFAVQKNSLIQASQALNAQFGLYAQIGDPNGMIKILKANEKIIRDILPLYGIKNVSEYLGDNDKEILNAIVTDNEQINAGNNTNSINQQGVNGPIKTSSI